MKRLLEAVRRPWGREPETYVVVEQSQFQKTRDPGHEAILKKVTWWRLLIVTTLVFAGAVTFTMTFDGRYMQLERVGGASLDTSLKALAIAGVITTQQILLWGMILAFIGKVRGFWRKLAMFLAMFITLGWTFQTSSKSNFVAMAGESSRAIHFDDAVEKRAASFDGVSLGAVRAKGLVEPIVGEAAAACQERTDELAGRGPTASAGKGAVSAANGHICRSVGLVGEALKAAIERSEERMRRGGELLAQMQAVLDRRDLRVADREEALRVLVSRFDGLVREMKSEGLADAVRGAVLGLRNAVSVSQSSDGSLGALQVALLKAKADRLNAFARDLETILGEIDAKPVPRVEPIGRTPIPEIVSRYRDQHWVEFYIAYGVDTWPAFIGLLLLIIESRPRNPRDGGDRFIRAARQIPLKSLKSQMEG